MSLHAGVLTVTVEYAKDLKDVQWVGKQDPYVKLHLAGQTFQTKTCNDGGSNPVFDETFNFNVIDDNTLELEIFDEEMGKDEALGTASLTFSRARETGSDAVEVPLISKQGKQQGFISIKMHFTPQGGQGHGGQHHHHGEEHHHHH